MMQWGRQAGMAAVLAAALLAGGCKGARESAAAPPVEVDTTNADELDGLSSEQIQAAARAMSPEEAAARGIVDTTIHLENLGSPDSVTVAAPAPAAPSTAAAGKDSVRRTQR